MVTDMNKFLIKSVSLTVLSAAFLAACAGDAGESEALQAQLDAANTQLATLQSELQAYREHEEQTERSRQAVAGFFGEGDMIAKMDPGYIQHNPVFKRFGEINGVSGRAEAELLFGMFMSGDMPMPEVDPDAPVPPQGDPLYLVVAEGDVGVVIQQQWQPDPQNPGEFYESFWFDAWRVGDDGLLTEHWDGALIEEPLPPFLLAPLNQ
jgi:predicted SnoaL-like aldol condensation-catalyzing enzyme